VLGAPLPGYLAAYVRHDLTAVVVSRESAEAVAEAARASGPLTVHVKVDTGMNRLGVAPPEAAAVVRRLGATPGVTVEALGTHLATADGDGAFAREQAARFDAVVRELGDDLPPFVHIENSPSLVRGLLAPRERGLVRLGGALYGLPSSPGMEADLERLALRAAMRLTTRVVHVHPVQPGETVSYGRTWTAERPTRIGTLAAGYADGLPRGLSNTGTVGVRGRAVPIVGRVCMDLLMVDLGPPEAGEVAIGDEAVLFGAGGPTALAQATAAGTISYALTACLTPRVARTWV
jgi:alanine racemase